MLQVEQGVRKSNMSAAEHTGFWLVNGPQQPTPDCGRSAVNAPPKLLLQQLLSPEPCHSRTTCTDGLAAGTLRRGGRDKG